MAKKAAKKTVTKKAAAPSGKTPGKKTVSVGKSVKQKSSPAKKAVAKKAVGKKAPAKKAVAKKAAPAKKAAAPKAPAKKAPAKKSPAKKSPAKKTAVKKAPTKKTVVKKTTVKKEAATDATAEKKTPVKKAPAKKATAKKAASKKNLDANAPANQTPLRKRISTKKRPVMPHLAQRNAPLPAAPKGGKPQKLSAAFLKQQRQKLLDLRDSLVDQMNGVARDTLGRGEDNSDSSAFGMHQADAGSDSYDRDFALNILSQEQDAINEIEEALLRLDAGTYGICEGSDEPIPIARLEAMPFARCTVEFQEKLDEEQAQGAHRAPVTSLFGLDEKEVSKPSSEDE